MKKYMHFRWAFFLCSMMIFLCSVSACAGNDQETSQTETNVSAGTDNANIVKWAVPADYYNLTDLGNNVSYLNQLLKEDGYEFQLSFVPLAEDYYTSVLNYLDNDTVDILSLGFETETESEAAPEQLIKSGLLYKLDDYLNSPEGNGLYGAFYEKLWESVTIDGSICLIPSQYTQKGIGFAAFRRDIFGDDIDCDGSIGEILSLVEQTEIPEDMTEILWYNGLTYISTGIGYQYYKGIFVSTEDGNCYFPFQTEELHETYRLLNESYLSGTLDYNTNADYRNKLVSSGKAAVWVDSEWTMTREEAADEYVFVQLPYTFSTVVSGGTGIYSESTNKENALALLTLLYTDEKYTNALFWGEQGINYDLTDGMASYLNEEHGSVFISSLMTGIYDLVYPTQQDDFPVNRKETKWSLYGTEAEQDSWTMGFLVEDAELKEGLMKLSALTLEYEYIWQREDFETAWDEVNQRYEEMNGDQIVEALEKQIQNR